MNLPMKSFGFAALIWCLSTTPRLAGAQSKVDENVVYGMYSGLALLMDVHYPDDPNGFGIVFIHGSAWHTPLDLDAVPLKLGLDRLTYGAEVLLENGYTLFAINHRAAPRFRYPAAVEDAQRAVRYVRYNADNFGIDPDRIGALGGSSGGHLISMLGVLDGDGDSQDDSPINQESSKVQAVVALFPATDFPGFVQSDISSNAVTSFVGSFFETQPELFREASPTSYVSTDDPPFLLIHGDADEVVPYSQSEIFQDRLTDASVTVELIRVPGGGHGRFLTSGSNTPDYIPAIVDWFDSNLRGLH